jgi:hypothetical protein
MAIIGNTNAVGVALLSKLGNNGFSELKVF